MLLGWVFNGFSRLWRLLEVWTHPVTSCSLPMRVACMAGWMRSTWRLRPQVNRLVWQVLPVADGTEDLEKYIVSATKARSARRFMTDFA